MTGGVCDIDKEYKRVLGLAAEKVEISVDE
jgi:hypothetical protein